MWEQAKWMFRERPRSLDVGDAKYSLTTRSWGGDLNIRPHDRIFNLGRNGTVHRRSGRAGWCVEAEFVHDQQRFALSVNKATGNRRIQENLNVNCARLAGAASCADEKQVTCKFGQTFSSEKRRDASVRNTSQGLRLSGRQNNKAVGQSGNLGAGRHCHRARVPGLHPQR